MRPNELKSTEAGEMWARKQEGPQDWWDSKVLQSVANASCTSTLPWKTFRVSNKFRAKFHAQIPDVPTVHTG